ncbi:MAG: ABC transporter ATP-binding protein [Victivallaceae bacterium]|nr:ABC transporter ATP-binding protein [Victivallaceae bacterium]
METTDCSTDVTLEKIAKSYTRGVPVIEPLNLTVKAGELFFLLGPSGCGKSTLLRMIAGLVEPTEGRIFFGEAEVTKLAPNRRKCAMVFQNYALWPHWDVYENVAFALRVAHRTKDEIVRLVGEALDLVQMQPYAKRNIASLSGGQQQRVALARAIASEPRLLLLDEPLSNLDAKLRDSMREEIAKICREKHLTAIYVTHDRKEAMSVADRIAVLHRGVLQMVAAPEEAYNHPANAFVAEFLGDVNFLEGEYRQAGRFATRWGDFATALAGDAGSKLLMARPEKVALAETGGENSIPGTILSRQFLGDKVEWRVDCTDRKLTVSEARPGRFRVGDRVFCRIDPADLIPISGK